MLGLAAGVPEGDGDGRAERVGVGDRGVGDTAGVVGGAGVGPPVGPIGVIGGGGRIVGLVVGDGVDGGGVVGGSVVAGGVVGGGVVGGGVVGGGVSSFVIVATPVPSATVAFVTPVTFTEKVSLGSTVVSPFTGTVTAAEVEPGAKLTVFVVAV